MELRYGDVFDLAQPGTKQTVNELIAQYGKARSVNEVALTIYCEVDGKTFELAQFHHSRRYVSVCR